MTCSQIIMLFTPFPSYPILQWIADSVAFLYTSVRVHSDRITEVFRIRFMRIRIFFVQIGRASRGFLIPFLKAFSILYLVFRPARNSSTKPILSSLFRAIFKQKSATKPVFLTKKMRKKSEECASLKKKFHLHNVAHSKRMPLGHGELQNKFCWK